MSFEEQTAIAAQLWNAHESEDYRRDESHWRGEGRWEDASRWVKIGHGTVKSLRQLGRMIERPGVLDKPFVALEWGPGGGSNLVALAPYAERLFAVDISDKNLEESRRVLAEKGFTAFDPIHLQGDLAGIEEKLPRGIDIFVSTAVFQHFPSKKYGAEVLHLVAQRMNSGGVGLVQIRYDNGNPRYAPKAIAEYKKKHITATSYALDEFWEMLKSEGLVPHVITGINNRNNYARFLFERPE